jgi:hypothetical protein
MSLIKKMNDEVDLLTGKEKTLWVLPQNQLNINTVAYYIEQAIEINRK